MTNPNWRNFSSIVGQKSGWGRKLQFCNRQLQISDRFMSWCSLLKLSVFPYIPPEWGYLVSNFVFLSPNYLTRKKFSDRLKFRRTVACPIDGRQSSSNIGTCPP